MNKLKVYKFIVIKKKKVTPSLDTGGVELGASQVSGIKASRIRFGPANRVGPETGHYIPARERIHSVVGLGQSLKELGGNDIGIVPRTLHGQVFPGACSTCKSLGVPSTETRNDDSARIRG